MEQGIELAREAGWKYKGENIKSIDWQCCKKQGYIFILCDRGTYHVSFEVIFLDPLFWRALIKSIKLPPERHEYEKGEVHEYPVDDLNWREVWHRFIDHLAEGKPVDEFFNQIIKSKK